MTIQLDSMPHDGLTTAKSSAKFLKIGLSSWWLAVKQGRIKKPIKLSIRTSRWECEYVRKLANEGLPPAGTEHPDGTQQVSEAA